jgi:hypothetical protein
VIERPARLNGYLLAPENMEPPVERRTGIRQLTAFPLELSVLRR